MTPRYVLAFTALVWAWGAARAATPPGNAAGAKLFIDTCAVCHTIGGGDTAGPDLIAAAHKSRAEIEAAVKRMQENVGPLEPAKIEALVSLLQAPDAKARIALAAGPPAIEIPPELKAASAETGRRLFFGEQAFSNRGIPCAGCHAVAGHGGNLAVDLTAVHARRGDPPLIAAAEQPAIPLMKAAYGHRPVTRQEAYHLLAFFRDSEKSAPVRPRIGSVHMLAAGLTLVVLGGIAPLFRSRRAGTRSRMVGK
jgi:cytochrome c553